ncbi:Peroxisome chaperone and import receptor [Geranomyces variabilis]|uniref:Peroxisome chaperone and import receptor n=1 Tax=Geranomyces variabilis TaxID=109894 RepID=A0AAD5TDZ7_9FUNG|nr:Peroxisome chaperone and import receptor [Geranomyces variabilis]
MTSDDVDDLDSYLDDFTAPPPPLVVPASASSAASADPGFDDDFARQLAADMEQLFKGAAEDDATAAAGGTGAEVSSALAQIMETFKELQAPPPAVAKAVTKNASLPKAPPSTTAVAGAGAAKASFQDTVAQTMRKLRTSSDKVEQQVADDAKMSSLTGGMSEEAMEAMMKELEGMMSSGDFDNALGGMMEQLMSKELLYEPMKDLASKYPAWLKTNEHKLSSEDIDRYKRQHGYVSEIVRIYDESSTSEATDEEQIRVAQLMQQMQDCGNPPEEILQELAPGLQLGADGMPNLPGAAGALGSQDCNIM